MVSNLKDEDVDKALQELRGAFLDQSRTDDKAVQRAALEGLIRRLGPGVVLISKPHTPAAPADAPFLAEILDTHIAYLRLGALSKASLSQLDASLASFADKSIDAAIIDLRGVPPGGDFEAAAEFARRFCPKGKLLFSLQKPSARQERIFTSNQDPVFQGIVLVLTDADTSGAAEALAATLRLNAGAMIIGSSTPGEAVEFTNIALNPDTTLRVAVAQVILPETGPIFPDGVKPDVSITLPRDIQEEIFAASQEKGVSQFVFEDGRQRLNEAALVAKTNPEIDSYQASLKERGRSAPLRDTVLQRAVDLVTAISFYSKQKK